MAPPLKAVTMSQTLLVEPVHANNIHAQKIQMTPRRTLMIIYRVSIDFIFELLATLMIHV